MVHANPVLRATLGLCSPNDSSQRRRPETRGNKVRLNSLETYHQQKTWVRWEEGNHRFHVGRQNGRVGQFKLSKENPMPLLFMRTICDFSQRQTLHLVPVHEQKDLDTGFCCRFCAEERCQTREAMLLPHFHITQRVALSHNTSPRYNRPIGSN